MQQSKETILWDFIIEQSIATEAELRLVTNINGYSIRTLNDVISVRTEYETMEQYQEFETL